ncbi:hypothetical protein HK100_002693, partial [Physocladia obscura]
MTSVMSAVVGVDSLSDMTDAAGYSRKRKLRNDDELPTIDHESHEPDRDYSEERDDGEEGDDEEHSESSSDEVKAPSWLCETLHAIKKKGDRFGQFGILDLSGESEYKTFKSLDKKKRQEIRNIFESTVSFPKLPVGEADMLEGIFDRVITRLKEPILLDLQTHLEGLIFPTVIENSIRRTIHQYMSNASKLERNSKEVMVDTLLSNFLTMSLLNVENSALWTLEPGELQSSGSKAVRSASTIKSLPGQKLDLRLTMNEISFEGLVCLRSGGIETSKKKMRDDLSDLAINMRDNLIKFRSENLRANENILNLMFTYGVHTFENKYTMYGMCNVEHDVFAFGPLFSAPLPLTYSKHGVEILQQIFSGLLRMQIGLTEMEKRGQTIRFSSATTYRDHNRRKSNFFKRNNVLGSPAFKLNSRRRT